MEIKNLQKLGGWSALTQALIYVGAFIVYGAVLQFPQAGATATERLQFLSDNHLILATVNLVMYVVFGIILAALVLSLQQRLKPHAPMLSALASIFGYLWVGLVIASGMIITVGLHHVIDMGSQKPENALQLWTTITTIGEGLGGGNEIVGGLWVLLLSLAAWRTSLLPKPLVLFGALVGVAGILTVYPLDLFTEIFGLSQIVWFIWLGVVLLRKPLNR